MTDSGTRGPYPSQETLAAYWNGICSAILVYDVSSAESFESCKGWLEELKKARCVGGQLRGRGARARMAVLLKAEKRRPSAL